MSSLLSTQFNACAFRLRSISKTALLLSFIVGTHAALAAPVALTLGQAQQQAVARSRQLMAQDHASAASREMAVAAGQLPDPILKVGVDNLPVSGPDRLSLGNDFMTMRRVGISQEFTRADKRHWRSARLEREADKASAQKDVTLASIQRDTAIAWLDLYYTEQMAAVVSSQTALSHQEIEAAEAAYRGGRGSQADILAARSALLALDDRRSEIGRRLLVARTMLARWTGASGEVALAGAPNIDKIRLDPATLDTDLAHHPQIAVMNRQEDIAQAEANLAQANRRADWSVEVAFQQRGAAYSNMVSVGISVPLQWDRKNRQDRELASKLAMVEQTKAERDEMLRDHVAEARVMIVEWQNGRERVARYVREWIPLADERSQAMLAAYRGGKSTLAEVLAARRNETDVRMQALQLQMETARLWAQLNFLFPENGIAQHSAMTSNQESK
ncbi:TolC family protein [Undibacterium sp. Jales W-56]|uniref:TolC family protein n=1 Tax=Undibacterium sp. Jales W-56 TaxID=2897325 RepID=UPI0021D1DCA1|nr:TolC family protein [Undibacterium sp. Jales W-56]MCU6435257.1 TolC family protein [Undibacterium sp. Jales W-56]